MSTGWGLSSSSHEEPTDKSSSFEEKESKHQSSSFEQGITPHEIKQAFKPYFNCVLESAKSKSECQLKYITLKKQLLEMKPQNPFFETMAMQYYTMLFTQAHRRIEKFLFTPESRLVLANKYNDEFVIQALAPIVIDWSSNDLEKLVVETDHDRGIRKHCIDMTNALVRNLPGILKDIWLRTVRSQCVS